MSDCIAGMAADGMVRWKKLLIVSALSSSIIKHRMVASNLQRLELALGLGVLVFVVVVLLGFGLGLGLDLGLGLGLNSVAVLLLLLLLLLELESAVGLLALLTMFSPLPFNNSEE